MTGPKEAELRLYYDLAYGGGCAVSAVLIHLWPHAWWSVLAFGLVIAAYGIYRYANAMRPSP